MLTKGIKYLEDKGYAEQPVPDESDDFSDVDECGYASDVGLAAPVGLAAEYEDFNDLDDYAQ